MDKYLTLCLTTTVKNSGCRLRLNSLDNLKKQAAKVKYEVITSRVSIRYETFVTEDNVRA